MNYYNQKNQSDGHERGGARTYVIDTAKAVLRVVKIISKKERRERDSF
jgi:hypothetical protein